MDALENWEFYIRLGTGFICIGSWHLRMVSGIQFAIEKGYLKLEKGDVVMLLYALKDLML